MVHLLRKFTENPYTNIIVGLVFFFAGLSETYDSFDTDIAEGNFHAHHGAIIFGLFSALKHFPHIFEGLELLEVGQENLEDQNNAKS